MRLVFLNNFLNDKFMFVNTDNETFRMVLNSNYVDKSGLISILNHKINSEYRFICVSRARRFGKSVTAHMLNAYYSKGCDSEALFSNLEISKDLDFKTHLNKYDVIYLDMQSFELDDEESNNYLETLNKKVTNELIRLYPDLLSGAPNPLNLPKALSILNKKFVFIIDEWDFPLNRYKSDTKLVEKYIDLLRKLFKETTNSKNVPLVYMTGILPLARYDTQSALNNFTEFTMVNPGPFAKYYGFTEDEVAKICKEHNLDPVKTKLWYEGYHFDGYSIYNPNAIAKLIVCRAFLSYWSQTASYTAVKKAIESNFANLREDLVKLCSGDRVSNIDLVSLNNQNVMFSKKDSVLLYLIHLGYLAYDLETGSVYSPNEETRRELIKSVEESNWQQYTSVYDESKRLIESVLQKDNKTVANLISKFHEERVSVIDYNSESALKHVILMAFLATEKYYLKPIQELPSGKGFADIVYLPNISFKDRLPALIIELKYKQKAISAIEQIKERHYDSKIREFADSILYVGINYDPQTKYHECIIEEVEFK